VCGRTATSAVEPSSTSSGLKPSASWNRDIGQGVPEHSVNENGMF
jgi:hypothetical protein